MFDLTLLPLQGLEAEGKHGVLPELAQAAHCKLTAHTPQDPAWAAHASSPAFAAE